MPVQRQKKTTRRTISQEEERWFLFLDVLKTAVLSLVFIAGIIYEVFFSHHHANLPLVTLLGSMLGVMPLITAPLTKRRRG